MFEKAKTFIKEARQEFQKVDWPSSEDTIRYTTFVIIISLSLAAYLGALDYVFVKVIEQIV